MPYSSNNTTNSRMKSFLNKMQQLYFGYLFIALVPLAMLAFWKTYFSGLLTSHHSFHFYFHLHVVTAVCWLVLLIVQPILFRQKKLVLHRKLGKLSYVLFPLLMVSIILLAHYRYLITPAPEPVQLLIPFKDIIIAIYGFSIALYHKKRVLLHARGMLLTGLVFLEPVLVRVFSNYILRWPYAMYMVMGVIYSIFIIIIISERKTKEGRWIFPPVFLFYILVHLAILNNWNIPFFNAFANWFSHFDLT